MARQLLVPIDFTEKSVNALKMAKFIQDQHSAEIHIAHVIPAALSAKLNVDGKYEGKTVGSQKFIDDVYTEKEKLLTTFMSKQGFKKKDYSYSLIIDILPDEIAKLLTKTRFDLTIVGNYVHSSFEEMLWKTHPERIVELSKNPVLTINTQPETTSLKQVLVPVELMHDYREKIALLLDLQKWLNCEFTFVQVVSQGDFKTTEQIQSEANFWNTKHSLDVRIETFNANDIKEGILQAADYFEANAIAFFSRRSSRLSTLIKGNITEYLIKRSDVPIFTFNLKG